MGPEPVRIRHAIYPAQPAAVRSGRHRDGEAAGNHVPPSLIVEIHGEIDIFSAPGLRDELLRVIRRHGPQLALDLAGVTFIDCAGVNVLLATRRRAGLEDGSVDVIGASPRVRRVISLLGLEWAFGLR